MPGTLGVGRAGLFEDGTVSSLGTKPTLLLLLLLLGLQEPKELRTFLSDGLNNNGGNKASAGLTLSDKYLHQQMSPTL